VRRGLLRENATWTDVGLRLLDPLLVGVTGLLAYTVYLGSFDLPAHYRLALGVLMLCTLAIFPAFGLYRSQRGMSFAYELRALLLAWLALAIIAVTMLFLTKTGAMFSRGVAILWVAFGFVAHASTRAVLRAALRSLRRHGYNLRHVVIVGAGPHGRKVAAALRDASWSGFAVRAFYDDDPALADRVIDGVPVRGGISDLVRHIAIDPPDQVFVALALRDEARISTLLEFLRQSPIVVRLVPDLHDFMLLRHSVAEVAGMPVVNLTDSPHGGMASTLKAIEDYTIATVLLVVTLPLWLAIAAGIKLTSAGPVLHRQQRVTWSGVRFTMLKFRTMSVDAETTTGPVWARRGDARTTSFGRILRRLSLDELPQLVNVLRGEMSLVGPRPERPELVERFREAIPGYMQKHLVKAGITGWAQVNDLRGDTDLKQRINYDLHYIEHWTLWFDFRILVMTLWHILTSRNAQ
jgi:putative colanic acid biosynthesis UDP-glucose lipid carrier transferase